MREERVRHFADNLIPQIKFKDWEIWYSFSVTNGDSWIQWTWTDPDYINGGKFNCKGRKWRISEYMTDSEFVQTAFLAAKVAMEHEIREAFTYKDRPVMRPHYDVDSLVELCDKNAVSKRAEPKTYEMSKVEKRTDTCGHMLIPTLEQMG